MADHLVQAPIDKEIKKEPATVPAAIALSGRWAELHDCHVRPDLILIHEKVGRLLRLVRLGSPAKLGLE